MSGQHPSFSQQGSSGPHMNLVGFCQPPYAIWPLFRLCSLQAYLMPCSLTNFSKLTHYSLALQTN